ALVYQKRGNFMQAMALWGLVLKARPSDAEAQQKLSDLAVHDTIRRGNYETAAGVKPETPAGADEQETLPAPAAAPAPRPTPPVGSPRLSDRAGGSAADPLRRRIEANPTDAKGYLHLASYHRRAGDYAQARAALQEGLGPTGNSFDLIVELAELE